MKTLTKEEMMQVKGGISVWVGVGIAALAVFLAGLVDGIVHPNPCEGGEI